MPPNSTSAPPRPGARLPEPLVHRPRGTPRPNRRSLVRATALVAVHLAVLAHLAHWRVSGRTLSPLEPSEAMQTLELGWVNAGAVLLVLSVGLTLVLGRFFCGWACHVVAYQDLCAWLLGRIGLRPRPVRVRLLKLVPLAAAIYMFAWPSVERLWQGNARPSIEWRARLTTSSFWRTFPKPWMAALTILVDGGLVVWWMGAKGFCTYGCPYGALFGLADRFAVGRIRVNDSCEGCGHCTAVCTSNVRVHQEVATFGMVVDPGCMKCLDCVNSCPKDALYFGKGKPSLARRAASSSMGSDLTWPEEILAAIAFLGALYAFRDLFVLDRIPFLLAIGLPVIASIAAVALARLARRSEFQLQWTRLRSGGRLTRAGVAALVALPLLLAFTAYHFVLQYHVRAAERALDERPSAGTDSPSSRAA